MNHKDTEQKKNKPEDFEQIKRIVFIVLSVLWMIVIFSLSADPAVESDAKSGRLIALIGNILNVQDPELFALHYEVVLRKCAHATEYMILAFLLGTGTYNKGKRISFNVIVPLAICALYACSDEFHQLFVPGRDGAFKDVLIDTAGAAAALTVLTLIRNNKTRNKKNKNNITRNTKVQNKSTKKQKIE